MLLRSRFEDEELARPGIDRLKTRLSIYRARIERSFSRNLGELRTLQENLLLKKAMVPQSPDYPTLVNVGRIRKEMQAYFKGAPHESAVNKQTEDDSSAQAIINQIEEESLHLEAMAQRMEAQTRR